MYGVKMFNANGVQLYREAYDARSGEFGREYVLECDTLETARWVPGQHRSAHRPEGQRNRIEYFEITGPDGALIETVYPYNETRESPYRQGVKYSTRRFRTVPASQGDAPARSALSPQWGPVAAREAASVAQDDTAERVRRGAAWLNEHIPGWRDMIEGEPGYTADQLARIAFGADSQGNSAAVPWIQECARVKAERADRIEPNPYWGDIDVYAVTVDNESTGALGVIVYRASDGELLEFTPVEHTMTSREAPAQALRSIGYDVQPVNARSLGISDEEWRYYADEMNWPATSEKYQNGLAERLSDTSEFADDTMGDVEGFGHFALFKSDRAMLQTDNLGFVGVTRFSTEAVTQNAWEGLARDYERFCLAGTEDALPTGECDAIFLIFDTARHIGSVADRDEIAEHVSECPVCGPYRYVLDSF